MTRPTAGPNENPRNELRDALKGLVARLARAVARSFKDENNPETSKVPTK
jgi:hypothetical protein